MYQSGNKSSIKGIVNRAIDEFDLNEETLISLEELKLFSKTSDKKAVQYLLITNTYIENEEAKIMVKKLQDYFVDEKVPRGRRDHIPLLTSPKGILWVVGHRRDRRFVATRRTCQTLLVTVSDWSTDKT